MHVLWSLWTLCLLTCQVIFTPGDLCLCCSVFCYSCDACQAWLLPFVRWPSSSYPEVNVTIREDNSDRCSSPALERFEWYRLAFILWTLWRDCEGKRVCNYRCCTTSCCSQVLYLWRNLLSVLRQVAQIRQCHGQRDPTVRTVSSKQSPFTGTLPCRCTSRIQIKTKRYWDNEELRKRRR